MRTKLQNLLAVFIFLLIFSSPSFAQTPCEAPPYRQFDFWIGEWRVLLPDGSEAGRNIIASEYGGCMLSERYSGRGQPYGASINAYNAITEKWQQTWIDKNGLVLNLSGNLVGDTMVMTGEGKDQQGKPITHKISWQPQTDGTVVQHWQFKHYSTETWNTLFKGIYKKAPPKGE